MDQVVDNVVLGGFALREKIGEGGFGNVYLADQQALGRTAVVKVMRRSLAMRRDAVERFLLEARLASRLDHPCAAHIYACGTEADGTLWIAMELVKGTSLDTLLEAGPLAIDRVVPMLERLCEAVQVAHEQGIVHRDIKPANVMVAVKGNRLMPKLLDFGIAKQLVVGGEPISEMPARASRGTLPPHDVAITGDGDTLSDTVHDATTGSNATTNRLTQAGQILGSPPYMAPEQWTDPTLVGGATDQYAIALLAYEALTGERARQGANIAMLVQQHLEEPLPQHPLIDAKVYAVLTRATAKTMAGRYPDLNAFMAALRDAAGMVPDVEEDVPALRAELVSAWSEDAPQPIAEAIAALGTARSSARVVERTTIAARVLARWLGVLALACRQHGRGKAAASTVRELRRHAPRDDEWLELITELAREADGWPMPELATWARDAKAVQALRDLVRDNAIVDGDRAAARAQAQLARLATVLDQLAWLLDYSVGKEVPTGIELWLGQRSNDRVIQRGPSDGDRVVVLDADSKRVLALSPLVIVAAPAAGDDDEMFVFTGPSRSDAAQYCAFPRGFERDDLVAWAALGEHLLADGDVEDRSPYPGLAAFTAGDRSSFVGRERETAELVARLDTQPLIAVVGPSGAGKSSFLAAGIAPVLAERARVVTLRPGRDPVATLVTACERRDGNPYRDGQVIDSGAALPARLVALAEHEERFVLIVDQAEELFTQGATDAQRTAFAEAIVALAASPKGRVLIGMRDDFMCRVEDIEPWRGIVARDVKVLGVPGRTELERIVREPARRRGHDFEDPELPAKMVADVIDRPGALPLLAFAAAELWERRDRHFKRLTKRAYEQIGGVTGALVQHADAVVDDMTVAERKLVKLAFRRLLTAEGSRVVMRRDELVSALGADAAATRIVERLLAARLVVSRDDDTGERIEIIHEALTRTWPRLAAWRSEDAAGAKLHEQLAAAAKHWDERGRSDGLLWRGAALVELERWSSDDIGFTPTEVAFMRASRLAGRRAVRRKLAVAGAAFVALSTTVVVLAVSSHRIAAQRADAVRRVAAGFEERGRVAELGGDNTRALLYLAEAARLGEHGPTHDLLVAHAAAAVEPLTEIELRARGPIDWATLSERRIVMSSEGTFQLWDRALGRAVVSTPAHFGVEIGDGLATIDADGTVAVTTAKGVSWRAEHAHAPAEVTDTLAVIGGTIVSTSDAQIKLWDGATGKPLATLDAKAPVVATTFDRGGHRMATSAGGEIRIWDLATYANTVTCVTPAKRVNAVVFTPDGQRAIAGADDGVVRVCDLATGQIVQSLSGHLNNTPFVAISPDGTTLVSASFDGTARLWRLATGEPLGILVGHRGVIRALEFSPDGRSLATGGDDATIRIWDVESATQIASLEGHGGRITALAWTSRGLESASFDATVRRWDVARAIKGAISHPHHDVVETIEVGSDGTRALSQSRDHGAIVWDVASWTGHDVVPGATVASAALLAPTHVVASTGHAVRIDGTALSTSDDVERVASSRDGHLVATASKDGTLRLWDATGAARGAVHVGASFFLVFDPTGRWLFAVPPYASSDGAAVIDTATMREVTRLGKGKPIESIAVDGQRVGLAELNGVTCFELGTWVPTTTIVARGYVEELALAPDGRVVTALNDATAVVWGRDGRAITTLPGNGRSAALDISTDDRLLAVGTDDGAIDVWDLTGYRLLATFHGHHQATYVVRFSPDGHHVLSGGKDGRVASWSLDHPTRDYAELARLVKCRVPLQLEGESVLPRDVDFDDPACR